MQDVLPAAILLNGARCQVLLDNNLNTPISITGTSAHQSELAGSSHSPKAASGGMRALLQTNGRLQAHDGQLYGVDGLPLTINVSSQARAVICHCTVNQAYWSDMESTTIRTAAATASHILLQSSTTVWISSKSCLTYQSSRIKLLHVYKPV